MMLQNQSDWHFLYKGVIFFFIWASRPVLTSPYPIERREDAASCREEASVSSAEIFNCYLLRPFPRSLHLQRRRRGWLHHICWSFVFQFLPPESFERSVQIFNLYSSLDWFKFWIISCVDWKIKSLFACMSPGDDFGFKLSALTSILLEMFYFLLIDRINMILTISVWWQKLFLFCNNLVGALSNIHSERFTLGSWFYTTCILCVCVHCLGDGWFMHIMLTTSV